MAKSVAGIRPTVAILIAFLLIVSLVVPTAEGVICPLESKRSKTWSGVCVQSKNCDKQCKTWERAKHGACHATYGKVLGVKVFKGSSFEDHLRDHSTI
ncbi:hypothetical protein GBA52_026851 [Prunus armeniaca]|nr:hypothetical protein GBA52_026851 [Prunus armeniaca]